MGPVAVPAVGGGIAPPAAAPVGTTTVAAPITPGIVPAVPTVEAPAPAFIPDTTTAAAPIQATSVAAGPAGTLDTGLDPPDQTGAMLRPFRNLLKVLLSLTLIL